MAIGEAVTALATGLPPTGLFDPVGSSVTEMRAEIVESIIDRAFGNSKAKTAGTGIWLSSSEFKKT